METTVAPAGARTLSEAFSTTLGNGLKRNKYLSLQFGDEFLSFRGSLSLGVGKLYSGGELSVPSSPLLFVSVAMVELRWIDSVWVRTGVRVVRH